MVNLFFINPLIQIPRNNENSLQLKKLEEKNSLRTIAAAKIKAIDFKLILLENSGLIETIERALKNSPPKSIPNEQITSSTML